MGLILAAKSRNAHLLNYFTNPYYPRQLQAIPSKIMVPRWLRGIQNGVEEMCIPRFSR